jgi:hypothetical protein
MKPLSALLFILLLSTSTVVGQENSGMDIESVTQDHYLSTHKPSMDLDQIVQDVDTLWAPGTPGPLLPVGEDAAPIVGGNLLTASIPSIVGVANSLSKGHIIALSAGILSDASIQVFDNAEFIIQSFQWLSFSSLDSVLISTGHREWDGKNQHLKDLLSANDIHVKYHNQSIDSAALTNVDVLVIGNAWGDFTKEELQSIQSYVEAGGGLLLTGLGWSWSPYNDGKPLDDYPMNKIGEFAGVRWIDGYLTDNTHSYEGSPLFLDFYPNLSQHSLKGAMEFLDSVTTTHGSTLPDVFRQNNTLQAQYVSALSMIKELSFEQMISTNELQEVNQFFTDLITSHSELFTKGAVYDSDVHHGMAWIREYIHFIVKGLKPLSESRISDITTTLGLTGTYKTLWEDYSILLLDNSSLDEQQQDFIYTYISQIPRPLINLQSISVRDYIGENSNNIAFRGNQGSVNIFSFKVGQIKENAFPNDVPPGYSDVFSIVVAHEVNHIVDAYYVNNSDEFKKQRDLLIQNAGTTSINYLRSMFNEGFFTDAPQEFFASISNQWFTDSEKTMALGKLRFDNNVREPIKQAVFIADVYSLGSDSTYFYELDTEGNLQREAKRIDRDENERITSILIDESKAYTFQYDASGEITRVDYGMPTSTGDTSTGQATIPTSYSLNQNYPNPFNPTTSITYSLPQSAVVSLKIYDITGKYITTLVDGVTSAGIHTVTFDAGSLSSGMYVYTLETDGYRQSRQMMLVK